jgi:hypothetical protein
MVQNAKLDAEVPVSTTTALLPQPATKRSVIIGNLAAQPCTAPQSMTPAFGR